MSVKTAKGLLQYVDTQYGYGGLANYDQHQISIVRDFLRIINSSAFTYVELQSLKKILEKFSTLSNEEKINFAEIMGEELENKRVDI